MRVLILILAHCLFLASGRSIKLPDMGAKLSSKSNAKFETVPSDEESSLIIAQKKEKIIINGPLCMFGGMLAHMAFGTMYCWANFLSYVPPSLQFFDGTQKAGQPDALYVLPVLIICQCVAMPVGTSVVNILGASKSLLLGGFLVSLGVFLSSFAKSLPIFMLAYSLLFGSGVGMGYTAPMIAGWKWLPSSKGLVSGVILMGYGLGGFIFNLVGTKLANPNGLEPINGRFPDEVYANFPKMLRTLSIMYAALFLLGSVMITEPAPLPPSTASAQKKSSSTKVPLDLTVSQAVRTPQFWLIWSMIIMSASTSLNVANIYKRFATTAEALHGDAFQATVGGLGAVCNGGGRLIWGMVSDKIGFKKSFLILTILETILQIIYPYSKSSKPMFLVMTCLCFFCLAGNFALVPPAIQRLYGSLNGAKIYSYLFSAFGVASVGGLFLSKALLASFGWEVVFRVLAGISFISAILTTFLTPVKSYAASVV
mmetsp:Transcript_27841/g.28089  ORF Transcript_27841/g.28089 Transcript_27841/m.28089 type:complete len:483 (+) Transcript_27841:44-1492(+)